MPYTPPPKADFIAIFPTFAAVTDEQYAFWSEQATLVTEPIADCLGQRMDLATMLVTAHYLVLAGIGAGAESEIAAQGTSGFKRIKSGSLELERGDADKASTMGEWGATSYGQRAWPMLSACLAGPRVAGTGTVPYGVGYRSGPFPWQ